MISVFILYIQEQQDIGKLLRRNQPCQDSIKDSLFQNIYLLFKYIAYIKYICSIIYRKRMPNYDEMGLSYTCNAC